MAWVYILRGATGRYYIGSTENLPRRICEHRRGSNRTTRRFGEAIELVASRELPSIVPILAGAVGANSGSGTIVLFFVCRTRIGLTRHDIVFVKLSLRRIIVWSTIFVVITGSDVAKAGPFRDFFTALRGAFAQPNEKPRRHRTSHKHNETPPSDASNNQNSSIPAPAPPDQRNVRTAKAASGANQQKTNLPYGVPVPGKEWLVTSPFAPDSGYVDVTGFPHGTAVEDPYTGKTFLTP